MLGSGSFLPDPDPEFSPPVPDLNLTLSYTYLWLKIVSIKNTSEKPPHIYKKKALCACHILIYLEYEMFRRIMNKLADI